MPANRIPKRGKGERTCPHHIISRIQNEAYIVKWRKPEKDKFRKET